jgi:hypothetical protein
VLLGALFLLSFVSSFFLWASIDMLATCFRDFFGGKPLPWFTSRIIDFRFMILLLPLPWFAYAVRLLSKGPISLFTLTALATTLTLSLISTAIMVFFALAVPWIPMR